MKLSELKSFNKTVWFLILGTMFSKASYFISMPYLAIRLKTQLELNPVAIGVLLGIGPLVGILGGFYLGHLSDHWGRKRIFSATIFFWSVTFLGFAFATQLWHFALLNTLNGLCNSANHPVSAALISDLTEPEQRKSAFHLRYFAINLGASFGPLLGAWLLLREPSYGFILTAAVYLIYGIACAYQLPTDVKKNDQASTARRDAKEVGGKPAASFSDTLRALASDRPLLYYTLAFVLMGVTYAQLDSTMPQYLQSIFADEGIKLFGLLMAVNALTVVVCQLPLTKFTSHLSLLGTVKTGSFVYGLGLMCFGLFRQGKVTFILSMIVLTLGEILIFSNGNLLIDRIAPEKKKGAYFGASGLWALGPALGPALGGYVLMRAGGQLLFVILGVVGMANILLYSLGSRNTLATGTLKTS